LFLSSAGFRSDTQRGSLVGLIDLEGMRAFTLAMAVLGFGAESVLKATLHVDHSISIGRLVLVPAIVQRLQLLG
jgi:hypothetical protein